MIVNDHSHGITHIHAGFIGSVHDSHVFVNSHLWLHHVDFFKTHEYILTNMGYYSTTI